MAPQGLLESFLAAIQASLSVLLVIFYGGLAAKLKLLDAQSTKAISKVCVRMFLPALLITNIGAQLEPASASRYALVFAWAVVCHLVSFLLGIFGHLVLGMPDWTTVALMFNNTTSYPLLLIGALDETGILASLVKGDESTSQAIERAKSYFLIFATVSSCLTFAVGPRLVDSEHAPEEEKEGDEEAEAEGQDGDQHDTYHGGQANGVEETGERTALLSAGNSWGIAKSTRFSSNMSFFPSSRKPSENPKPPPRERRASVVPKKHWIRLGPRARWWLLFVSDFFNAPLIGAVVGVVIGLVPALQKAFFEDTGNGGIFTAWLTASLKNIGGLFVPLPVVVAGVSLWTSIQDSRSKDAGDQAKVKLPKLTVAFILLIRFVMWPALSIGIVYGLASRTTVLGDDAILWFVMMLMPTGPPAMKLIALVQTSNAEEGDEGAIARVLTISYLVSPILSFTVVGSLLASQACM